MRELPSVLGEMMTYGEVNEQYYNDSNFPLDKDHHGVVWQLKSNADHLTRSKVLYHPSVIAKKNEDIRLCVEAQTSKQFKIFDHARTMYEVNKDTENKLNEKVS